MESAKWKGKEMVSWGNEPRSACVCVLWEKEEGKRDTERNWFEDWRALESRQQKIVSNRHEAGKLGPHQEGSFLADQRVWNSALKALGSHSRIFE